MRARRTLLGIAAALCALPLHGIAADRESRVTEYRLKAVFLYNFTQFVEWPASAFADGQSPFTLCVLGEDPFGRDLDDVVQGETVGGRAMKVQRLADVPELRDKGTCQILFIGEPVDPVSVRDALAAKPHRAVLTVSDMESRLPEGVMIGFAREKQRIRLRVDGDAARAAGLTVSTKLLRLGS